MPNKNKITVHNIRDRKGTEEKICAITAYDCTFARLADRSGVDVILVGDSMANTILGLESTVPVTLEQMIDRAQAVVRGVERALVIADMPFGSVQTGPVTALENAVRVFKNTGVDSVKVEGGRRAAPVIRSIVEAGIPVMGHVGLTPQFRSMLGGLKVQGRDEESARHILEDALAVEEAGCYAVVLEAVPRPLAGLLTSRLSIPTIGIGAGPSCDGQILVLHDVLGLTENPPKFARAWADLSSAATAGIQGYCKEVRGGTFPDESHSFRMDESILEKL